ncbi:MAG: ABC transporter substrate-binding protein [Gammaproteobacteria bacterium]|nr:ABC transporter substrate-binding protein [Gammaproteobacteria bacterium]MDH5799867.1 ABC transporter substrate-binding protein [Gammaproteobacteria bacterium]
MKVINVILCLGLVSFLPARLLAADHPAQTLVVNTTKLVMEKLRAEEEIVKKDSARLMKIVDENVLPNFDFHKMSSWVLGKYWRKASKKQKAQFTDEFKTLLVRTYSKALLDAIDKEIKFLPMRSKKKDAKEVTVRTEVDQKGGFPIPIDYKLYEKEGKWLVYDVVIDALSLVSNYRTSFSKTVRESGIDHLIKTLAERNADEGKTKS